MRGQQVALRINRMRREVKAEGITLRRHALCERPAGILWQADRRNAAALSSSEQAVLAACPLVVRGRSMGQNRLGGGVNAETDEDATPQARPWLARIPHLPITVSLFILSFYMRMHSS